jgi:hypothetical protein
MTICGAGEADPAMAADCANSLRRWRGKVRPGAGCPQPKLIAFSQGCLRLLGNGMVRPQPAG